MPKKTSPNKVETIQPEETLAAGLPEEQLFSPLDALVGVVIRPRATFERMRDAARGHWWLVLALMFVALVLVTVASVPIEAEAARAALEAQMGNTDTNQQLSADQQTQVEQIQGLTTSYAFLGGINLGMGIIGLLISYLFRAGVLFLMAMALGGRASFQQVWRMAVWTTLPNVLRSFVNAAAIFATGSPIASGLSAAMTRAEIKAAPALAAFLGGIDLYLIWSLVLVAVGVYVTSQLSRAKSVIVTLIYWLITVAISVGFTALGQALAGALVGG